MLTTRLVYRLRGALFAPVIIFSILCFKFEYETDLIVWLTGPFIFMLGFGIRVWAQQHLHYRLKIPRGLTKTGPYRLTRNPIYIGNALIFLGLTILAELIWLIPFVLLCCIIIYPIVVNSEEKKLLKTYGTNYREYMTEVPRWIPKIKKLNTYRNLQFFSKKYFFKSLLAEIHCLLLLIPFIIKELISPLFE